MDIVFNCPGCEQELAVDGSGAGSEIQCPSCGENIVIPEPTLVAIKPSSAAGAPAPSGGHHPVNAIASSAAAKVELHLKVPVSTDKPTESLITKPLAPLEVAARESDKKIRVKTIRHTDCVEVGHDTFDEVITKFLEKVGEAGIISINPLTYTHLDIGSQKMMTDYAVMIVYRG